MKVHILFNFREGPWGGGNQFLKALRGQLQKRGRYVENPEDADVVIFNSYPFRAERFFLELYRLKRQFPEKVIVYRLDGPISLIRGKDRVLDKVIALFAKVFVDGVVYQSDWSREQNKTLFRVSAPHEVTVYNAPDGVLFYPTDDRPVGEKVRLIATSWSANPRKGFDVYRYLDEHLDFDQFDMTFVGNSPIEFKNITSLKPVSSQELGALLREHDIFITASKTDPCSNSLIEALASGLPAVVLNDGGHPELVAHGGEVFDLPHEAIEKVELVAKKLDHYRAQLPEYSIEKAADAYAEFAQEIVDRLRDRAYVPKRVTLWSTVRFAQLLCTVFFWKVENKILQFFKRR